MGGIFQFRDIAMSILRLHEMMLGEFIKAKAFIDDTTIHVLVLALPVVLLVFL
jgi:hypothetical protein